MKMAMTGKYVATRNLSIDGKMHPVGSDVSWWTRANEFVGKSIHLERIDKRPSAVDYASMSDEELHMYAKAQGVSVTWNMKRETILERLD